MKTCLSKNHMLTQFRDEKNTRRTLICTSTRSREYLVIFTDTEVHCKHLSFSRTQLELYQLNTSCIWVTSVSITVAMKHLSTSKLKVVPVNKKFPIKFFRPKKVGTFILEQKQFTLLKVECTTRLPHYVRKMMTIC